MKVVLTVTAVYDFPDDVVVEDLIEGEESMGQHVVVNGRKLQPYIEFLEYEGLDGGEDRSWSESEDDELDEILDDSLDSEEYTIIQLDAPEFDAVD